MTAITVRAAHTTATDRLLVQLGLALVRLGRARARRRELAIHREHAVVAAERRLADYERGMLRAVGPRR